ncbi:MAG: peptidylprolyl isomerase [Trueperaceae bacterium]
MRSLLRLIVVIGLLSCFTFLLAQDDPATQTTTEPTNTEPTNTEPTNEETSSSEEMTRGEDQAVDGDSVDGDPVILRVNDEEMLLSEFNERFTFYANNLAAEQGMQYSPEMAPMFESLKPQYLEQLSTEKVLQQEGLKRGLSVTELEIDEQIDQIKMNFESEEAYLEALSGAGLQSEAMLRKLLGESELSRRTAEALRTSIQLKPYQLQLYYDQHKSEYGSGEEACARHILVETEEEARAIQTDLAGGKSFKDVAMEKSIDSGSGAQGGDLGCFAKGQMIPVFEEAAFTAPLNEVTEPIQSEFGYHLILPYERKEATTPPLEDVEDQVTEGAQNDVLAQLIDTYQAKAKIETFAELVSPAGAEGEAVDEMMNESSEEMTEESEDAVIEDAITEDAPSEDASEETTSEETDTETNSTEETSEENNEQ